jgi:hypothetical protein
MAVAPFNDTNIESPINDVLCYLPSIITILGLLSTY